MDGSDLDFSIRSKIKTSEETIQEVAGEKEQTTFNGEMNGTVGEALMTIRPPFILPSDHVRGQLT